MNREVIILKLLMPIVLAACGLLLGMMQHFHHQVIYTDITLEKDAYLDLGDFYFIDDVFYIRRYDGDLHFTEYSYDMGFGCHDPRMTTVINRLSDYWKEASWKTSEQDLNILDWQSDVSRRQPIVLNPEAIYFYNGRGNESELQHLIADDLYMGLEPRRSLSWVIIPPILPDRYKPVEIGFSIISSGWGREPTSLLFEVQWQPKRICELAESGDILFLNNHISKVVGSACHPTATNSQKLNSPTTNKLNSLCIEPINPRVQLRAEQERQERPPKYTPQHLIPPREIQLPISAIADIEDADSNISTLEDSLMKPFDCRNVDDRLAVIAQKSKNNVNSRLQLIQLGVCT